MIKLRIFLIGWVLCTFAIGFASEKKFLNVTIHGLTCPYCISMLIKNLGALPDIEAVRISSDSQRLLIEMKPDKKSDIAQINSTITNSGFQTTSIKEVTEKTKKSEEREDPKKTPKENVHLNINNQPCGGCHNK